jgi:PAS domain S-box-containing protein
MTEKEQYLSEQISKKLQFWISKTLLLGIALFPFVGVADWFLSREVFNRFAYLRAGITAIFIVYFFLNRLKRNATYQYVIVTTIIIFSAITIEIMVLSLGGHASSYYAGIILVIIAAMGFIPFSLPLAISTGVAIYAIYLVPILLFDEITDVSTFIANNIFMLATFAIALTWRILSQRAMINELSLQYDLEKEKSKLQVYSTKLEDLVAEKTKELTISEQRFRALFDNANDGIVVLDAQGIMVNVNRRFCELHGFDQKDLIGVHFRLLEVETRKGEIESRMMRILGGEAIVYEAEHYKKDGSRAFLEISSKAIDIGGALHLQSFHRDITEKKKFQEQLMQSQKMESIGVLAGGIAHDFNNILTAILGHAEVLRRMTGSDEATDRRIKIIEDAARRAGQMVSKLLSFARQEALEMTPTQLNDVVQDTVDLLERTLISRKIQSVVQTFEGLPAIFGDSIQLEQVITNLLVNAADAMPGGGTITVTTSLADLEQGATRVHPLLSPGTYVVLTVSDTGTGIPGEIMGRIFDPFFTTKPVGKGTGLGLAMVYGIVKGHKGEIRVRSRVGEGTSFEIYLPASDRQVEEAERISLPDMRGRENVLVVDDEKDVLSFIKDTLEARGYRVVVADNPIYALDLFKNIAGEIDLVITDMVMPLVSGIELIRQFKAVRPEVKMIAMSGVDLGSVSREKKDMNAFMKKPFDGVYLLSVVRRVLDAEGSAFPAKTTRREA